MQLLSYLQSGAGALASYLAAHVLLCLLPAFFIAGALSALFPKEAITKYLGNDAPKWISYPAAAVGGFVLAVCSCTIMPLFAGIYKKGAGLGPAITFLFVGPAINILAISFTGVQIGLDIALARVVLSLIFGVMIGVIVAWVFRKDEDERVAAMKDSKAFDGDSKIAAKIWVFFVLLMAILLAGTLQIGVLTNAYISISMAGDWMEKAQIWLNIAVPANAEFGIEGVSLQGAFLIINLLLIGITAFLGLNHIDEGFNLWSYLSLALVTLTLLFASVKVDVAGGSAMMGLTGKFFAEASLLALFWVIAWRWFKSYEIQEWLWETWRFVKQIIPYLLVGVFTTGVVRELIPAVWVTSLAGENTLLAKWYGVLFGVVMYFPTLVEVPIAQTFLSLGMHRGPLLAYLLADPGLSVQSILITSSVIGKKKTAVYVVLVSIFSTISGYLFGLVLQLIVS
ncbi:MAG: permease [Anaerolineaceae bacterium]|nr:permease [Anaerolineaceae bacterium]